VISTTLIQKELKVEWISKKHEGEDNEDVSREDARREIKIIHR
jgi:hypothetical protein